MPNYLQTSNNEFGIPDRFVEPVRNALTAAAAIGPAGLFGGLDAVAVGAVWTTLFIAIKDKSNSTLGSDPKRICGGIAAGVAQYYIGCKIASWLCFLIPGVGPVIGVGVSSIVNVYFTYRFACAMIDLMNNSTSFSKDDKYIIERITQMIAKFTSTDEVKKIWNIYRTWVKK